MADAEGALIKSFEAHLRAAIGDMEDMMRQRKRDRHHIAALDYMVNEEQQKNEEKENTIKAQKKTIEVQQERIATLQVELTFAAEHNEQLKRDIEYMWPRDVESSNSPSKKNNE